AGCRRSGEARRPGRTGAAPAAEGASFPGSEPPGEGATGEGESGGFLAGAFAARAGGRGPGARRIGGSPAGAGGAEQGRAGRPADRRCASGPAAAGQAARTGKTARMIARLRPRRPTSANTDFRHPFLLASFWAVILDGMSDVTQILSAIEQGDPHAADQLLPLVYDELRQLAAERLAQEKPGQTLQATA